MWQWADRNRTLQSDSSAEPGRWRSERTPYMIPIMEAFTEPKVSKIYIKASTQVGKSEVLNNFFGYIVDVDPGPILWVFPTVEVAEDYSKERLNPMIESTSSIKEKIAPEKSRNKNNTILKKSFIGGHLALVGSNSPPGLRSRPVRYVLGDELDAWAWSAGKEGDPVKLIDRRTRTFFNRKQVYVSSPAVAGRSKIEEGFLSGTQEEWRVKCPSCGEYRYIEFDDIRFDKEKTTHGREVRYKVSNIYWVCKGCGGAHTENEIKRQPGEMAALNPQALENGIRSFRLNAFLSPWETWDNIISEFLHSCKDPVKLQVVYNTLFGEVWEDRGDLEDEDTIMERRDIYEAELPEGVLVLTCGVDTQDDRLEYEVVGHGHFGETWGIRKGVIMGRPDGAEVWQQLDDVIDHPYRFASGATLKISITFIDSGGHYTQDVYLNCRERFNKKVFAIKGRGGDGVPYTSPPKKTNIVIRGQYLGQCWLYTLGVDSGKQSIMDSLKVKKPGPRYYHFPNNPNLGYGAAYFAGLISERLAYKPGRKSPWVWEKIPGHERNEALDCRNYALAAFKALSPDLDRIEQRLKELSRKEKKKMPVSTERPKEQSGQRNGVDRYLNDW